MKKKERISKLESRVESLLSRFSVALARLDDLEIRMDEATPKFPEVGKTEECQLHDHIKNAMDESRAFYQRVQSEIPKWVR